MMVKSWPSTFGTGASRPTFRPPVSRAPLLEEVLTDEDQAEGDDGQIEAAQARR